MKNAIVECVERGLCLVVAAAAVLLLFRPGNNKGAERAVKVRQETTGKHYIKWVECSYLQSNSQTPRRVFVVFAAAVAGLRKTHSLELANLSCTQREQQRRRRRRRSASANMDSNNSRQRCERDSAMVPRYLAGSATLGYSRIHKQNGGQSMRKASTKRKNKNKRHK